MKIIYAIAVGLFVLALAYGGLVLLVSGSAESPHDHLGIQRSFTIAGSMAMVSGLLALAALTVTRVSRAASRR